MAPVRLPVLKRLRPDTNAAEMIRRLENNVFEYAMGLTGDKGVLQGGVVPVGRALIVPDVQVPTDWRVGVLGAGWENLGAATDPRTEYRKTPFGDRVEVRGRINYAPGVPVTQAPMFTVPDGWQPDRREVFDCYGTVGATYTPAVLTCHTGALRWITGGYNNLSLSGDVWWEPVDRTPPEWPEASHLVLRLPAEFPGQPAEVHVEDALAKSGLHLGPYAALWSAAKDGRQWVVTIRNVLGLPPGGPYTLKLAVLSA